jgi:hypothetical protein
MTTETIERDAETALIAVPHGEDAYALFTSKNTNAADKVLRMVRAKIDAFAADLPNVETSTGRKAIASFAHKIAKSKTAIEEVGKELAAEAKDIPRRIDANRKHIRDTLDAWRDEIRQPVTDWEAAEDDRINRIKADLAELEGTISDPDWMHKSAECLRDRLGEVERDEITEAKFNEYLGAAEELKARAISTLTERISIAEEREAEAEELARLRAKEAAREAEERAEQLRKEGERRARDEAEADARAEKERADRKLADEKAAAERRERELIAEKEAAERRALEAAARAKQEIEDQKRAEKAEVARREADKAHKAKINRAALAAFVEGGIDPEVAKTVIKLIDAKSIPAIAIHY